MSLNGTWKLSWAGNPDLRAKGFENPGFDDSDWFDIEVPGCVEMSGFGSPGYTNQRYPHADLSHPTNAAFATIRDRQSGRHDYNPVSSYRTRFTVPDAWKDRRVILRFDGVYSAYYVWVNGKKVGYAEDSKLPSEFDITPYLNRTIDQSEQSNNVLAVEVYRWCDGSYLEDQDMTRFSGIFREAGPLRRRLPAPEVLSRLSDRGTGGCLSVSALLREDLPAVGEGVLVRSVRGHSRGTAQVRSWLADSQLGRIDMGCA